jgi:hypothetical protein
MIISRGAIQTIGATVRSASVRAIAWRGAAWRYVLCDLNHLGLRL